ncbi:hypothetical protein FKP32DRAFT_422547 [Trametes sanguinea]|nr:hypothetical protein FKP32DRAFT_422547 [Trametes sanguinea]
MRPSLAGGRSPGRWPVRPHNCLRKLEICKRIVYSSLGYKKATVPVQYVGRYGDAPSLQARPKDPLLPESMSILKKEAHELSLDIMNTFDGLTCLCLDQGALHICMFRDAAAELLSACECQETSNQPDFDLLEFPAMYRTPDGGVPWSWPSEDPMAMDFEDFMYPEFESMPYFTDYTSMMQVDC